MLSACDANINSTAPKDNAKRTNVQKLYREKVYEAKKRWKKIIINDFQGTQKTNS